MRLAARLTPWSVACGIVCVLASAPAVEARQQRGGPDTTPATALESALLEFLCGALRPAGTLETPAYLECRDQQLVLLRADFGRDLRRLTAAERAKIDKACEGLRVLRGQDAYIQCLSTQLVAMRGRGAPTKAEPPPAPAPPAPEPALVAAAAPPPAEPPRLPMLWIGGAAIAALLAGAGAFVALKSRRAYGTCRTCGKQLQERGDLCQACRHEAAAALRRASAERTGQARAQDEEQRRLAAREIEQRQRARDEEARRLELERAHQEELRQREEETQRRREEEASERRAVGAIVDPDALDPYAILGVAKGASLVDIETAYQAAKAKLDPDLVSGLGADLQEHFKKKGEAVHRAYETLIARSA